MWVGKLATKLYFLWMRSVARRYQKQLDTLLNGNERAELQAIAEKTSQTDKLFMALSHGRTRETLRNSAPELIEILDVKSVLNNPFILAYRRPALRLCPDVHRKLLTSTPVVTVPDFHFHASTCHFNCSKERAYVKVPFGLAFALGSIARTGFGVYEDLINRQFSTLKQKLHALFYIAGNITAPTPVLVAAVNETMGTVGILSVAKPAHVMHVMGVFVLLHEFGHVCLNHQKGGSTEPEIARQRTQEFDADAFALESILRVHGRTSFEWNSVRQLHTICVCILLLTLELHTVLNNVKLKAQYPKFSDRCVALLDRFSAPEAVRSAVFHFSYVLGIDFTR